MASHGVVLHELLASGLLAVAVAAPAPAEPVPLMPGVTYDRQVQFTPHGPVGYTVVTGPRRSAARWSPTRRSGTT